MLENSHVRFDGDETEPTPNPKVSCPSNSKSTTESSQYNHHELTFTHDAVTMNKWPFSGSQMAK